MQRRVFLCLAAAATVGACTVRVREPVAEVVVARPPPPPRPEPPPPPPPGDPAIFVWQPGHWKWNGHDYAWHPGHYEKRPARAAVWVPAEWVERGGQWVYHPGHWSYR
jgi:WXXGXW repeat (2 copies)